MNRRRPCQQRLVPKVKRQVPLNGLPSPLGIFFACNILSALLAVLFGSMAIAVVLAAAAIGCLACQSRKNPNLPI